VTDQQLYGDHVCRSQDHAWDVEPVGQMFQAPPDTAGPVVSTCQRCGVVRTYDDGAVTYRYPSKEA
jgi:hypothetical protein